MHIVLFFTFDYSLVTWLKSGHLTRELKFYDYLAKKGIEVSFVTYGDDEDLHILKDSKINIFPIYSLSKKSKHKVINIMKSIFIPFKLKKKIDTKSKKVIIKQNQLLGSWVSIIFKIITKTNLYTRTGYDMYLFSVKENKSSYKKLMYFMLTQITLLFSDYYSVTSNSDATFLKKRCLGTKKIVVRPNWVEIDSDSNEEKYDDHLLAVGRLEKQKNFHDLLYSAKETGFKIDIYGEGSLKQELINLSKSLNISLEIYDNIENDDLLNIYKKYKYFVSSSNFEGNSKVILEAMANGCIVIAKDIENNREIIKDNNSGLLYTNNLNEILIKCKNDDYKDKDFIQNAKNTIKNYYSKDVIFSDYFSDFEKIIQN
tara:strand:+ start:1118 stop:2230 length:1113 start_codon:yes stop_codon:yes gene_type:complete